MSFATDELTYPMPAQTPQLTDAPSSYQPMIAKVLFIVPVIISGLSYVAGGVPPLTDISFLLLTLLCVAFLLRELKLFPANQGIGAILLYGGVLVWFCHDYLYNWVGRDFTQSPFTPDVIARAAFYHCVFIEIAIVAMDIRFATWVDRFVVGVPEPANPSFYLYVLLGAFAFGISPYFLFTVQPVWQALFLTITLHSDEIIWTVHRSFIGHAQNVNYDWGGYVAQILQVGQFSGILGSLYAILIAKNWLGKTLGWVAWFFWVIYSFNSLRRGDLALMVLPPIGFLYYKHQVIAKSYLQKLNSGSFGLKAIISVGALAFALFVAVQYEGAARDRDALQLFKARGNTMFSEDMKGWDYFPDKNGGKFFFDSFPGEVVVRPIPDILFWFVTDPIPRALWNSKPIDKFTTWNNTFISGDKEGAYGTTIAGGAVGSWYFRFGPAGIIEGAIVFGWFLGVATRALHRVNGRPLGLMFALAFATAIFRCYRDLNPHLFDPILMAGVALYVLVRLFGAARDTDHALAIA